jgi:hypothetical protein
MSKTDTVKVTIQISERVTYQCTKEMPRADIEVDEFNLSREQTPVLIMQLSHQ